MKMEQTPRGQRLHKYIGFHNTDEVCNAESYNKSKAKKLCEDMLLKYFHELQDNITRFPLENYNGEVAYVGSIAKKELLADILPSTQITKGIK